MNTKQIEKILINGGIESNEAKIEAKMLFKHFLKLSDNDLILKDEFEENNLVYEKAMQRAKTHAPIQYIIGFAHFMGEEFIVNKNVLIPRDETEILVRKAIEVIKRKKARQTLSASQLLSSSTVLDIGTGSGCIACMIAKNTDAQVLGVDISTAALRVALDNASKLELNNRAIFRKSDIFSNVKDEKFDVIVSNPPYVPISEKLTLQKEITFEPQSALFISDNDGIGFYKTIIKDAPKYLNEGGHLLFECGINQANLIAELMKNQGFSGIEIKKDLAGIERVVLGKI